MTKRSIVSADVRGVRVLVRVDFNVPLDDGAVADDTRIRAALPTIAHLRAAGARIILVSHLGRPKGRVREDLRMAPVAERLATLLGTPVQTLPVVVGPAAEAAARSLDDGDVLLLENLRFDPGEEANDATFAQSLAALGELYVDDAFGAAHRAHASTEAVAHLLPAYAGLLLLSELDALSTLLTTPISPFVAILGGAKVSDKLGVIGSLISRVDALLLGGGMANTFLLATGREIGVSLAEPDLVEEARRFADLASERGVRILLPTDVVVAPSIDADAGTSLDVEIVPGDAAIFDIGHATQAAYAEEIGRAATVFWNGPMGVFERAPFRAGTEAVAQAVAMSSATTVVGGGDSVAALQALGLTDRISHVSTGGGASLEFLEGRLLPGVEAIPEAETK